MDTRTKCVEVSRQYLKACLNDGQMAKKALLKEPSKQINRNFQTRLSEVVGENISKEACLIYQSFLKFSVESAKSKVIPYGLVSQEEDNEFVLIHSGKGLNSESAYVERLMYESTEKSLFDFLRRNYIAKKILENFENELDSNYIYLSGSKRVQYIYDCIEEAKDGECHYHEALCRTLQTIVLASHHIELGRPPERETFYKRVNEDLERYFHLDAEQCIRSFLTYIQKNIGNCTFFGRMDKGIVEIQSVLLNPLISPMDRVKQSLILGNQNEKSPMPCSDSAQFFYKNMPTLLVFAADPLPRYDHAESMQGKRRVM